MPRAVVLAVALIWSACDNTTTANVESPQPPGEPLAALISQPPTAVCGEEAFDLLAGADGNLVGQVRVANDESMLYVSYATSAPWHITESHLAVTDDPDAVPRKNGQVVPGHFPDKTEHDPPVTVAHYAVPLTVLGGAGTAVVAAHADVSDGVREEGAWADGPELRVRGNWASYAEYAVRSCDAASDVVGPEGGGLSFQNVTMTVPQDALDTDTDLTITELDAIALPAGVVPGTAYDFGPDGQTFDEPITIAFDPYDDSGLTSDEEERLRLHVLRDDGRWWEVSPTTVDAVNNVLSGQVDHFTPYGAVSSVGRVQLRNVEPQPVPEGERLTHQVWMWNDTNGPLSDPVTIMLDASGPVDHWAYSTGQCDLTQNGSDYHFSCTVAAPDPGTAKVLGFNAYTAEGSEGSSISATGSYTYNTRGASTPTVVTDIVAPLAAADLDLLIEASPQPVTVGNVLDHTVHVVNLGPADVEFVEVGLEISGDVVLDPNGTLPAGCTLASGPADITVTCTTDLLLPGTGQNFTIGVVPQSEGEVDAVAQILEWFGPDDPDLGNNQFQIHTQVNP